MLGQFGIPLKAGEVILSGALVPLEPVQAGDFMQVSIGGIGSCSVRFV
jgi:2-oxopent-4-enoate/cis-2-oxohex-4-enoate hydratase